MSQLDFPLIHPVHFTAETLETTCQLFAESLIEGFNVELVVEGRVFRSYFFDKKFWPLSEMEVRVAAMQTFVSNLGVNILAGIHLTKRKEFDLIEFNLHLEYAQFNLENDQRPYMYNPEVLIFVWIVYRRMPTITASEFMKLMQIAIANLVRK
jgi:hypothetical protein